jgi:4-hydroxyphenylpyruvate dioxygenase
MEQIAGLEQPLPSLADPIGLEGIEYVEYATPAPQALGQLLESMGFRPVARHRSREILLYRQGTLNLLVNGSPGIIHTARSGDTGPRISAIGFRVRDARMAFEHVLAHGGWGVPVHAQVMELNIPGIHGPGGTHLNFIDRWREFSIYDIDFVPIPGAERRPPAVAGLHLFGIVQDTGRDRTEDWVDFYRRLLGFERLADDERFGILPAGTLLRSPSIEFYIQLVEPHTTTVLYDDTEGFARIGLGVPDVAAAVAALERRGIAFHETAELHTEARGAITRSYLSSVSFELVKHAPSEGDEP